LKNDNNILRHPGSIVWRLTLFYTLSASILLVSVTAFLYEALVANLHEEDKQFVAEKAHAIQTLLQEREDDMTSLEQEIQRGKTITKAMPNYTYFSRVLKPGNIVLTETLGMEEVIPASIFPLPVIETKQNDLVKNCVRRNTADGHAYLLLAVQTTDNTGQLRVIQVALDISREAAVLTDYKRKLAITLPLGILLSAMFGALITRRGMQPLHDITLAAQHITASHLHARINPDRWPLELRALAEAFDQMLVRLENSFAQLSQFSADLAHELRTPVNNLMGEAEVTLAHTRSEGEYRNALESVLEECSKLSRMIDSLLFLARADNVQIPLQLDRIDVRQKLEMICASYEAVIEEQSVTVQCKGESNLDVDPMLFRRAITNVLSNAIRHVSAGGIIKLIVEPSPTTHSVAIRISDNGCGIAREHLSKVFDRFYRVDQARSTDSHSTGLGLAIVMSIMTMHGGTASIESQLDKGTTITLHFPSKI